MKAKPPKAGRSDHAYAIVTAVVSGVPLLGGPASRLIDHVVGPPLKGRLADWFNSIALRLEELEENVKGFKVEELRDNPLFLSVITHATTLALRNHQRERLEALQNAVINCALGINLDENLELLFLDHIGSLTPLHLKDILPFSTTY